MLHNEISLMMGRDYRSFVKTSVDLIIILNNPEC